MGEEGEEEEEEEEEEEKYYSGPLLHGTATPFLPV
jgi:hypothetical protein